MVSAVRQMRGVTDPDRIAPSALYLAWALHGDRSRVILGWSLNRRDDCTWTAEASLEPGPGADAREPRVWSAELVATKDTDRSMLHLDSVEPGLLRVTLRLGSGSGEVLYARTGLLAELAVPGGRAELLPLRFSRG